MNLELYAFTCGWWQADPAFFIEGDFGKRVRSPVPAYLIEHPKGLAVFDTGLAERYRIPGKTRDLASAHGIEFDARDDIAAHIRAVGKDPTLVRWIINSHLHADHCGGNSSLPNAQVIVQRAELDYARAHADGMLYEPLFFDNGQPLMLIDGEYDLFGDRSVMLIPTFGKSSSPQTVVISNAPWTKCVFHPATGTRKSRSILCVDWPCYAPAAFGCFMGMTQISGIRFLRRPLCCNRVYRCSALSH